MFRDWDCGLAIGIWNLEFEKCNTDGSVIKEGIAVHFRKKNLNLT